MVLECPHTKAELIGGGVTSVAMGGVFAGLVFAGEKLSGGAEWATTAARLATSLLGYSSDILFAKRCFHDASSDAVIVYGYNRTGYIKRLKWLARSFFSLTFVKYVVVAVLDAIVTGKLVQTFKQALDKRDILTNKEKIRNTVIAVVVSGITFALYVNLLQFKWAYASGDNDLLITIILSMWLTLLLLLPAAEDARDKARDKGRDKGRE